MRKHWMVAACMCALALTGCQDGEPMEMDTLRKEMRDQIDPRADLERDDYRDLRGIPFKDRPGSYADNEPPVPQVSDILVAPRPVKESREQLVSISVTEDIPLKDVFIELSRLANIDLELDTEVSGGIIFKAKDKPIEKVVSRICQQAGLRYEFEDNVLKITRDVPYLKNYTIDFLNIERSASGDVNISTNVLSAGEGGGGDSLNTGSSAAISLSSESDLWAQFEEGIKQILESVKAPKKKSNSDALTEDGAAKAAEEEEKNFYIMNKEGGLVTVYGTHLQQTKISEYIGELKKRASAQVLIEAKILEITLDEQYQSGINWESVKLSNLAFDFAVDALDSSGTVFSVSGTNKKTDAVEALVNLTETFGTTRTLSSPRIHAINNQQAVFTFAENEVYFEIDVERETDTSSATSQEVFSVDSEIKTVPIGIILVVQPSINTDTDEITLNLRPTLSRVIDRVPDPAVAFLASQISSSSSSADISSLENLIPVVEVRELDTIMKIKDGDVLVMGGLMEERTANTDYGTPFLSDIPVVGNLFKNVNKATDVVEMVIFVRASIVPNTGTITDKDIEIYRKYTTDPRPIAF